MILKFALFVICYAQQMIPSDNPDPVCVQYEQPFVDLADNTFCCAIIGGPVKAGSGSSVSQCVSYCANPQYQAGGKTLQMQWLGPPTDIYIPTCQCLQCRASSTTSPPTPFPTPPTPIPTPVGSYVYKLADADGCTGEWFTISDQQVCEAAGKSLGFPNASAPVATMQVSNMRPRGCFALNSGSLMYQSGSTILNTDGTSICMSTGTLAPTLYPPTSAPTRCPSDIKCLNDGTLDLNACICDCKLCPDGQFPGLRCECESCISGPMNKTCQHGGLAIGQPPSCMCNCSSALSDLGTTGYSGTHCETARCDASHYVFTTAEITANTIVDLSPFDVQKYVDIGATATVCASGSWQDCFSSLERLSLSQAASWLCSAAAVIAPIATAACAVVAAGCDLINAALQCRDGNEHHLCGFATRSGRRLLSSGRHLLGTNASVLTAVELKFCEDTISGLVPSKSLELSRLSCLLYFLEDIAITIIGDANFGEVVDVNCYLNRTYNKATLSSSDVVQLQNCALGTNDQQSTNRAIILKYLNRRSAITNGWKKSQLLSAFTRLLAINNVTLDATNDLWPSLVNATKVTAHRELTNAVASEAITQATVQLLSAIACAVFFSCLMHY